MTSNTVETIDPGQDELQAVVCAGVEFRESVLRRAIAEGLLNDEQPLLAFIDTQGVRDTIGHLRRAFPSHFSHTFAVKANTMRLALELVGECGMGCEVASEGELQQALRAGFPPSRIVYDAPAKTRPVLEFLLRNGIDLNIDNFQEFERVRSLTESEAPSSRIGFRINPQVGSGSIVAMSTAQVSSKFGVPLEDEGNRERLVDCYRSNPWLNGLHTHIGSQGCDLNLIAEGIRRVVELAGQINVAAGRKQVKVIDIGGGLPVNFDSDRVDPTFYEYARLLQSSVPELFDGSFEVKTEFGRSVFAKNGFIAARVEYTKTSGGKRIALTHAGVQVATRTVFMPDHWRLRLSVHDASGRVRSGHECVQDVAGPCCFAGDMIATDRMLPEIHPDDFVVLHDTGAYYFSNPYYYNSLQAIAVYGARVGEDGETRLECWRPQQSIDDLLAMLG